MNEFNIVTLFPQIFEGFLKTSLIGKAIDAGLLAVNLIDLRDFAHDKRRTVDDTPYGGGSGMVMKTGPILECLDSQPLSHKILLTPQGRPFNQSDAKILTNKSKVLLFCGRYEGVDERVRDLFDDEISMGDFVLNGGEVAAMAVVESVSRLLDGVLGNAESIVEESFGDGLLEYPQYTRPEIVNGRDVPKVLLSGDHKRIARWRRGQSLLRTENRRPDLFSRMKLTEEDEELLEQVKNGGDE